jgi:hypothetical protein
VDVGAGAGADDARTAGAGKDHELFAIPHAPTAAAIQTPIIPTGAVIPPSVTWRNSW